MVSAATVTDHAQRKRAVVQQAERIQQESGAWESPEGDTSLTAVDLDQRLLTLKFQRTSQLFEKALDRLS